MTNRAPLQGRTGLQRNVEMRMTKKEEGLPLTERKSYLLATPSPDNDLIVLLRSNAYRLLNTIWKVGRYVTPRNVGNILEHRWEHENLTRSEWEEIYFTDVLPFASFNMLVNKIQFEAPMMVMKLHSQLVRELEVKGVSEMGQEYLFGLVAQPTKQFIVDAAYTRIIFQSDGGFTVEKKALEMLRAVDPSTRQATKYEDEGGHIDLLSDTQAFQVKPNSFIRTTNMLGLRKDQLNNLRAQLHYEAKSGKEVFYLLQGDILAGNILCFNLETVALKCGLVSEFTKMVETLNRKAA